MSRGRNGDAPVVAVLPLRPHSDARHLSRMRATALHGRRSRGRMGRGVAMAKTLTLPERQDGEGRWHQVIRDVCYGCGCRYLIAEDDHDLVWEPGADRSAHCTDEE